MCKRTGHSTAECYLLTRHCDFCGKPGHLADGCFKNPKSSKYRGAAAPSTSTGMPALSSEALLTLQNFNASVAQAATSAPSVASLPSSASVMQQQPVRTLASAASTVGDSSYTPDLSPQQAAYQRAHALLKQQFGLSACGMTVRDDDLLLDSGATFHFSGRRDNVRPLKKPAEIWAATGPVVLMRRLRFTMHSSQHHSMHVTLRAHLMLRPLAR